MASCEIIGTDYAARVTYTVTQSVEKNQSVVKVTKVELKALGAMGDAGFPVYIRGSITVNGVQATVLAFTDTRRCKITLTREYAGGGEGSWSGFSTNSVTVYHEDDGTANIPIKAILSVYMARGAGNTEIGSPINKTVNVSLPTIPRVSSITASAVELGSVMSIQINRAASSFTDTVSWSCGALSGTIATNTAATSLSWTVPLDLANQAPSSTRVSITLTVNTYSGGNYIGSRSINVSCGIPASMVPSLQISVADRMGYVGICGGYVQGQSQARVITQGYGSYGSYIARIDVRCGSLTGTGSDVSFALVDSGQVTISVTVTDSRGRTATKNTSITVLAYQKPSVAITDSYRCDENGNRKPDGAWMKIVFNARITALTGNTAAYMGSCTVHNTTQTRQEAITACSGIFQVTGGSYLTSAGIETAYDCRIIAMDRFCAVESNPVLVSVAFALMDFCRDTKAVGIGMRAKTAEKLSIGLNTDMNEHGIENLTDPVGEKDAANKGYVDAAVRKAAARNLLDNSDFRNPVNQRGRDSYTGIGYTIDRWLKESNSVVTLTGNGINIDNTAGSGLENFIQKTDSKTKDYLIGKKVTLAIKTQDGIFCGSDTVYADRDCAVISQDTWQLKIHFFMGASSYQVSRLVINVGASVLVEWIALYEGEYTAETLPEYQPKGYGAELLECQRYYYRINGITDTHFNFAAGLKDVDGVKIVMPLPVNMRIQNVAMSYQNVSGEVGGAVGFPTLTAAYAIGSVIFITVTAAFGSDGQPALLRLEKTTDAYIAFSADL